MCHKETLTTDCDNKYQPQRDWASQTNPHICAALTYPHRYFLLSCSQLVWLSLYCLDLLHPDISDLWTRFIADKLTLINVSWGQMQRTVLARTGNHGRSSLWSYVTGEKQQRRSCFMDSVWPQSWKYLVKKYWRNLLWWLSHTLTYGGFKLL